MKKTAFISDLCFGGFAVFFLTLCLFRYARMDFLPAFCLAILCGVLACVALGALLQSKRRTYFLKKADESAKDKLLLHLALLSNESKTAYLAQAFAKSETIQRQGVLKMASPSQFYFLRFSFAPVQADDVAAMSRWKTKLPKTVLCNEISEDAKRLCKRLGIGVQTGEEVYAQLKKADALPTQFLGDEPPTNKKLRRKQTCLAKRNGKRFFTSGLLILFAALWTPFPYYYLIFGSTLLLISLFIRMFGYS